ncbi:ABC transporter ATP-binding protein [Candidatus Synchoanobacter obligatus]|uniref:ATP-binding cassette domain-containing protein n=1 Tax=Candidatus Synchoanobacter obligatus TaxID=2919597 RepID=A0ABT1L3B6_9GAMM|nr:ATP-binding cassette domain-containing protein [Candidatus Synchoanobacter obligatus]MCP8351713.1 ATP-binding cassette domain-containing protein [Candidatus Synchoanobacter obligatus]
MLTIKNIPQHPYHDQNLVDININSGQILWLSGLNGSGKTTVLRILAQEIKVPDVRVDVEACYISATPLLLYGLTVASQVNYYQMLSEKEGVRLNWLDHCLDKPVEELSKGQAQKLSLMRLCCSRARLWLLDEPFNGLDQEGVAVLCSLLEQYLERGGAVVYSSHAELWRYDQEVCLSS